MVSNSLRVQRAANQRRVPAPVYRPGQKVWLLARDLHLPAFSRKLAPRYVGPYVIEKVVNPSALRLQLPSSLKIHPVFHVSQVKPVATSALSPPAPSPPPPHVLEGGDLVWEVNRILAVRRRGRGFQYLVDWVGYGPEDRSWIPRSYLADPGLLETFYREHPQAVGRSPGVSRREGGTVVNQQAATPTPSSLLIYIFFSCVPSAFVLPEFLAPVLSRFSTFPVLRFSSAPRWKARRKDSRSSFPCVPSFPNFAEL